MAATSGTDAAALETQQAPTEQLIDATVNPSNQPDAQNAAGASPPPASSPKAAPKTPKAANSNDFIAASQKQLYAGFLNPMFKELEEAVARNSDILDQINAKMEEDKKLRLFEKSGLQLPEVIRGKGQQMGDVLKLLENMLLFDNCDEGTAIPASTRPARLKELDESSRVAVLAHSIMAYLFTFSEEHLRRISSRVTSDTTLWISRLFRFNEASAFFHEDAREGVVRVCRLALLLRFPRWGHEGQDAFEGKLPVVYVSEAAQAGLGPYICQQLGLPASCLHVVACQGTPSKQMHRISLRALEQAIAEDEAADRVPAVILAHAGTPLVGHTDDLQGIQDMCKKHRIWLHVTGSSLALLTLYSVPEYVQPAETGDSMTLELSEWLGLPAVPHVTLFKASEPTLVHQVGLSSLHLPVKLTCLPLWIVLQHLGHDGLLGRIQRCIDLSNKLFHALETTKEVQILGVEKKKKLQPGEEVITHYRSARELISSAICALLVFDTALPTIVFRFSDVKLPPAREVAPYAVNAVPENHVDETDDETYLNAANLWLLDQLRHDVPQVVLELINVEPMGVFLRFAPLESANWIGTEPSDVDRCLQVLDDHLAVIRATCAQQRLFRVAIAAQTRLKPVPMPNWAGLGAVQYVPETDGLDLRKLHEEMVAQLKSDDTAFLLGQSSDGQPCILFGMVTSGFDTASLVRVVLDIGKQVEESSRQLEQLVEKLTLGIARANEDLEKEHVEQLLQEGVFRQIPVVGSLVNWWSPPPKEAQKGRTFDLDTGTIGSTELTYKTHLQVKHKSQSS